jgi:NADPH-dependent 2,4-dienoyl-CoA reductase/sulfur reductase-like enzyme
MNPTNILVIGGVAAGASFAARARRLNESAHITVIERGPDVSFANCGLPYHIGGEIPTRDVLAVQTPATLKALLNLEVRTQTEAIRIDRQNKRVQVRQVASGETEWLAYDKLMLSPGAAPRVPDLPGVNDPRVYTLRNLADMDRIAKAAQTGMRAVVIGAGFIGLEMAEQLHRKGLSVDIVQIGSQVLPQLDAKIALPLENELLQNNIKLHLNDEVVRYEDQGGALQCHLKSGGTLEADFAVLSIGVEPESALAREAGLKLGERGHIVVNDFMQTDDPNIYAAGDVIETADRVYGVQVSVPLGGPANRQGRVAADHLFLGDKARP